MSHVTNQWGQQLSVGNIVSYVSKTGSHTTRKLGRIVGLAQTKVSSYPERFIPAVRVHWVWDGSYCDGEGTYSGLRPSDDADSTIRVNNVTRVKFSSLAPNVAKALR